MSPTSIMAIGEGQQALSALESLAAEHFHNSQEHFTQGIVALYQINKDRLWEYAKDEDGVMLRDYDGGGSFEVYLGWFCTKFGISRSSTQSYLKTTRLWDAVLGRDMGELLDIGVRRANYVRGLIDMDGRTGEVKLPPQNILPSGDDDVIDRVNEKIDEILIHPAVPLTNKDVRKAFTIDIDPEASEIYFFESADGIWYSFEDGDDMSDGVIIGNEILDALPPKVRTKIFRKLNVMELG